jgi:hypothetical protein
METKHSLEANFFPLAKPVKGLLQFQPPIVSAYKKNRRYNIGTSFSSLANPDMETSLYSLANLGPASFFPEASPGVWIRLLQQPALEIETAFVVSPAFIKYTAQVQGPARRWQSQTLFWRKSIDFVCFLILLLILLSHSRRFFARV